MMCPPAFLRVLLTAVALVCVSATAHAVDVDRRAREWVSGVVTKIGHAAAESESGAKGSGTVTIRVRIDSTGTLADVGIDDGSGSTALDARAIRAAKEASPFDRPPAKLLTLEGFTELSFPLQLGGTR